MVSGALFEAARDGLHGPVVAYFHRYADLSVEEAREVASGIWEEINGVNLKENIAPTRERANLILERSGDHTVREVELRNR